MKFVPPNPKQRLSLHNKTRGAVYGAVAGLVVGALGSLFLGWGFLLTAVLVGALIGFQLASVLGQEAPVCWWWRNR